MKYVYLDDKHNEYSIDDDAYQEIVRLVQANKLCVYRYSERHPYSEDNPCVGKGLCLQHLLLKQNTLTYVGSKGVNSDNRHLYRFLDSKGYVYETIEDSSEEATRSIIDTLAYYGFTPPATVGYRERSESFLSFYATLHGDLRSASVIVLSYAHYSDKIKGLFLLYKDGPAKELNRKGEQKALFTRADELVEASKDIHGEYHIGETPHSGRYESDTYEVISQLESAVYDVIRRLNKGNSQPVIETTTSSE